MATTVRWPRELDEHEDRDEKVEIRRQFVKDLLTILIPVCVVISAVIWVVFHTNIAVR